MLSKISRMLDPKKERAKRLVVIRTGWSPRNETPAPKACSTRAGEIIIKVADFNEVQNSTTKYATGGTGPLQTLMKAKQSKKATKDSNRSKHGTKESNGTKD